MGEVKRRYMKRPVLSFTKLSLFRDLKISLLELNEFGKYSINDIISAVTDNGKDIKICTEHVINVLKKFRIKELSEEQLLEWVGLVESSGPFVVCEENEQVHDCIEMVLKNILLVKIGRKIEDSNIERYIGALKNNVVLGLELSNLHKLHKDYSQFYKNQGGFITNISKSHVHTSAYHNKHNG